MEQMVRAHLLREILHFNRETALRDYLGRNRELSIGLHFFDEIPDQSTFWRTWKLRFTDETREFIEDLAEYLIQKAIEHDVPVPNEVLNSIEDRCETEWELAKRETERIVEVMREVVYPCLYLERAENCRYDEEHYWEMTTKMAMHTMAAHAAGGLVSDQEWHGDNFREQVQKLSTKEMCRMFNGVTERILALVKRRRGLEEPVTVAIDTTSTVYHGAREDVEETEASVENHVFGTKEPNDEYGFHRATIQIVDHPLPLVLGIRPVRDGYERSEIVSDLLDSAEETGLRIQRVLMDREFDGQPVLKEIDDRGLTYLVPKKMRNSDKRIVREMNRVGREQKVETRKLHLGEDEWHETNFLYVPKENWGDTDVEDLRLGYENKVVFLTNNDQVDELTASTHIERHYSKRWGIEIGYKRIKDFQPSTTSRSPRLRFFYFLYACLLYNVWRCVNYLVAPEVEHELLEDGPIVSFEEFLIIYSWLDDSII